MGLDGFSFRVEMEDGTTRTIPLDFDFSDITQAEVDEVARFPLPDGDYPPEHVVAAGLLFLKIRREIPEAEPEGFYPFALALLAGDGSVVEVAGG